jgi:ribonucleoside-triphosphate reductase
LYENDTATDIAIEISKKYTDTDVDVETIQNDVEDYLMRSERKDVARAYIRYRYKKEVARKVQDDFIAPIKDKLEAANV